MFTAQPWSPKNHSQSTLLPLKSNSRFFWTHNPKNWDLFHFTRGKKMIPCLLPSLGNLPVVAGTNGIQQNGRLADSSHTRTVLADRGLTVLNPAEHDYLCVYQCKNGSYYADKWTKIEVIAGTPVFTYDHEGLAEFRRHLVLDGHIKPPHEAFIKLMLINAQRIIDKYSLDQHIPERALKMKAKQEDYKSIKSFMALLSKEGVKCYDF